MTRNENQFTASLSSCLYCPCVSFHDAFHRDFLRTCEQRSGQKRTVRRRRGRWAGWRNLLSDLWIAALNHRRRSADTVHHFGACLRKSPFHHLSKAWKGFQPILPCWKPIPSIGYRPALGPVLSIRG